MVTIVTPNSIKSEWVQKEFNKATLKEIEDEETVILPLLFEDCDLPQRLKEIHYADFRLDQKQGMETLLKKLIHENKKLPGADLSYETCRLPSKYQKCQYCGSRKIGGAIISENATKKYPNVLCQDCGNWI